MGKLRLSLACWEYPRSKPILDGTIQPEGIELTPTKSHPSDTFWRAFRLNEFDVTEMSMASLIIATSRGESRWIAIPVFPCRSFFHTWILCSDSSGIDGAGALKGKRLGVHEYQMTAAVWIRGILQHEFNVPPESIRWFQERLEDRIPIKLPSKISLSIIPAQKNKVEMLVNNELDGILYGVIGALVDRSPTAPSKNVPVHWLFKDAKAEEKRYFEKTGIFPVNHVIVIKREIFEKNPWVPINLYMAFQKAKEMSYAALHSIDFISAPDVVWERFALEEQERVFGKDPYPYGFKANLKVIETIANYCYEQGLADRIVRAEELFAESTMDL